jgi:hypothetical protein
MELNGEHEDAASHPAETEPTEEPHKDVSEEKVTTAGDHGSFESDEARTDGAEHDEGAEIYSLNEEFPPPSDEKEPFFKRLAPYLTVAGLLLIARIVVYSLRRRKR